jgi:hypothetical protein
LDPDSIRTWKQLEEKFHIQYHSKAAEARIVDLAQVRQKRVSVFYRLPTEGYTQGGKFWVRRRRDQELEAARNTKLR